MITASRRAALGTNRGSQRTLIWRFGGNVSPRCVGRAWTGVLFSPGLVANAEAGHPREREPVAAVYTAAANSGKGKLVQSRFATLPLTLMVVMSVAACGSSSKSQTTSTTATTATATTSGSNAASSAQAAVCAQAITDLQPLQAAAATNNPNQIQAQAGQAASKIMSLEAHPGITAQTHAALGELTGALEAFAHGARDQALATQLTTAGKNLAAACR